MKALKLLILVSVFGLFAACGGGAKTEETTTDTTAVQAPAVETPAPATPDSTAKADSAAPAAAPAEKK
ncbi:MAG: hypothetical protein RMJ87_00425 [Cytophagales bacterium]|nr:hypothetical protein [Bernardetiaceae bacterium]MDW8203465.1 hypothetical protein [Cytophagales bacterium]